ncbi:hypothetical protein BDR05DRAFT_974138 [Suillus weaverae]|nr:hypothetical protein BDR05DRAFT_974138 [Suillus weaverae]
MVIFLMMVHCQQLANLDLQMTGHRFVPALNLKPPIYLYATIDAIPLGEVKWESFSCSYTGKKPESNYPPWMDESYDVWYQDLHQVVHNMLTNPDFVHEMDFRPYWEYSTKGEEHHYRDFMSADWAWDQADKISKDPDTIGATFVPVILGSDKTTVSIGTGNNEYYPLYLSIRNIHNNVQRAHQNTVAVIGFLAMPKTTKEHASDPCFRKFCRQLFHSSLSKILERLRPGMTKPEVVKFGDGHFHRVIYGLGPYIADYEEQVLLTCIVHFWCPCALPQCREYIEELVDVGTYLELWDEFGVVADLIPFTNSFPHTDICQLIAPDILHQLIKGTFKDHLVDWVHKYLLRMHGTREVQRILDDIDHRITAVASFAGLRHFPQGRGFKQWTGDDSKALMKVYIAAIEGHIPVEIVHTFRAFLEFCYIVRQNTITEGTLEKIHDAVTRFHHYCKIFLKIDFTSHGMLNGTCLSAALKALQTKCARTVLALTEELNIPCLPEMICHFLFQQTRPDDPRDASEIPIGKISVFNSACSRFYAPSDLSGIGGMRIEHIHACPVWRNEAPHYDCVFVNVGSEDVGIQGLEVVRICAFFSFNYGGTTYPCAVVRWFNIVGDLPDEDTGMWMVCLACGANNAPLYNIIHVDSIYRAAHLIPVYGRHFLHPSINLHNSYDSFWTFYVNKYADHHAFELAS